MSSAEQVLQVFCSTAMKQVCWNTVHLREAGTTTGLNNPNIISYYTQTYLIQALTKSTAVPANTGAKCEIAEKETGIDYYSQAKILFG